MKDLRTPIYIAISVLGGVAIGWLIRPQSNPADPEVQHIHSTEDSENSEQIWTCSMHPQIRQNEPGLCPICEMDLIPLTNMDNEDDPSTLRMSPAAIQLAQLAFLVLPSIG